MEPKITSYAGMLDQSSFKQWYKYQKLRAAYGYDAEEMSFLMSKPSFYFRDFEMMETGAKLTYEDEAVLSEIFCGQHVQALEFDIDDFGAFEKRIIRVRRTETTTSIDYLLITPWRLKGRSNAANFKIHEEKRITVNDEEKGSLLQQIGFILDELSSTGFFSYGRTGLEIFHEVEARIRWSPGLRPLYVKQMLYQQLSKGSLSLKAHHNQLHFQERNRDHIPSNPVTKPAKLLALRQQVKTPLTGAEIDEHLAELRNEWERDI